MPEIFQHLYAALVRFHLEYGRLVWKPFLQRDRKILERVQRCATRMVRSQARFSYEYRLLNLHLFSLDYRQTRGDLITLYWIWRGELQISFEEPPCFNWDDCLHGHSWKLSKPATCYRRRAVFHTHRLVNMWNGLDEEAVQSPSIDALKKSLGRLQDHIGCCPPVLLSHLTWPDRLSAQRSREMVNTLMIHYLSK